MGARTGTKKEQMTLLEVADVFKTITSQTAGLNKFSFGWPSDRVRSKEYGQDETDTVDLYPRVFWVVPEIVQDLSGKNDTYQVVLFFDDLLGYDDQAVQNSDTQIQKWSALMGSATAYVRNLGKYRVNGIPPGDVSGEVRYSLDSFAGMQRLISIQATFDYTTKSVC